MHATIYGRGQMVIPARARKEARIGRGDVVEVQPEGDGRIMLVRLERPRRRPRREGKLVRRKGKHPVITGGPKLSQEQLAQALAEFP